MPEVTEPSTSSGLLAHGLRRRLIVGASGTMVLNSATILLNVAITLSLTRMLGADGFGAFAVALAWAMVLAVPASLGLLPLVIRSIATSHAAEAYGAMRGTIRRASLSVLASSLAVVALGAAGGWLFWHSRTELVHPFWIGLALVPLISLTMIRQGTMQGLGRVVLGRVPDAVVVPTVFLVLVGVSWAVAREDFTASRAIALNVLAAAIGLALGGFLLWRSLPAQVHVAEPVYESSSWEWLRGTAPLLVLNGATVLQGAVGTLLLGAMQESAEAGIYNVAVRAALIPGLVLTGASYALMPVVARLHSQSRVPELQRLLTTSTRWVLAASLPLYLGLAVFAGPALVLFGEGFGDGETTMQLVAFGSASRLVFGVGALVLVMAGHDRSVAAISVVGVVLTTVADVALIPPFGSEGAAAGLWLGLVSSSAIAAWLLWKRMRLWAPVIGTPRLRHPQVPVGTEP